MELEGVDTEVTTSTEDQTQDSAAVSTEESAKSDPLSYEKGVKLSDKLNKDENALDEATLIDLDKAKKFRLGGKVFTLEDLKKERMMRADYTKKTQALAEERKAEQKYWDNLDADLDAARKNPSLVAKFKEIYPEKFHRFVSQLSSAQSQMEKPLEQESMAQQAKSDPRIDEVYNWFTNQRKAEAERSVDNLFDKLGKKYPSADELKILSVVQAYHERAKSDPNKYRAPSEADVEKLFREDHDRFESRVKTNMGKLLEGQRKVNGASKMPGAGGGIPGAAPKSARTIKEASVLAMSDPNL